MPVYQPSHQTSGGTRAPRGRRIRCAAALLALLTVVGYVVFVDWTGSHGLDCYVEANGTRLGLQQPQAANAATIGAVASSRDLPERALTIALATAMQESKLHDIKGGDRDSLGLFQQRPSQGWGTAEQILDPVYSSGEFFDELVKIPGYSRLPLTAAAQKVQHSGFPQAYAKHEADASMLAAALYGREPSLSCRVPSGGSPGDPVAVRQRLAREFGAQVLERQGSADGAPAEAAGTGALPGDTSGSTVTVPGDAAADPTDEDPTQHGWALAQWAVAHAPELRIAEVAYRGRIWRARESGSGWVKDAARPGHSYGDVRITVEH
ncbi:hypothetical protein P3G67_22640 [Streptomyces sp. RB6PN23]|uniref:ARB-07466-like C-terminal domain-containing protein n=1 Tax=Streptomyces silvisoli TaxID=3034235 RepID=A0ABT5ZQ81_9ACTN|nr:hypothetical protein [Streptomyces silvisoli]MDF3291973.1 hypothetical protein [Streptomyces silvisoli]